MLLSYMDTRDREDRSEARAAESLRLQRQEAGYREAEAQLSVYAMTGQLDQGGLLTYAKTHKLPARAIDQALAKADAYTKAQDSDWRHRHSQGEQLILKALTKGPFEVLEPVTADALSAALDEYTQRSKAYGGAEDPLTAARDLLPKYQESISADAVTRLQGLQARLRYASPAELEANKDRLPPTLYQEQKKLFKDRFDLQQRLAPKPPAAATKGTWERLGDWWTGPQRPPPQE
jgi:hypothetical protein